jgi:hypothetical protein
MSINNKNPVHLFVFDKYLIGDITGVKNPDISNLIKSPYNALLSSGDVVHSSFDLFPVRSINVIGGISIIGSSMVDFVEDSHSNEFPVTTVDLLEVVTSNGLGTWSSIFTSVSVDLIFVQHPHVTIFTKGNLLPSIIKAWNEFPAETLWTLIGDSSSSEDSIVSAQNGDLSASTGNLSSKSITLSIELEVIICKSPTFALLILINDSGSVVDSVVVGNSPDMSVSTDSNINESVVIGVLDPASTGSGRWGYTVSEVDTIIAINAPDITVTADIELDHHRSTVRFGNFSPVIIIVILSDRTDLFEPDLVSVVNTPQDWSITNRDMHK